MALLRKLLSFSFSANVFKLKVLLFIAVITGIVLLVKSGQHQLQQYSKRIDVIRDIQPFPISQSGARTVKKHGGQEREETKGSKIVKYIASLTSWNSENENYTESPSKNIDNSGNGRNKANLSVNKENGHHRKIKNDFSKNIVESKHEQNKEMLSKNVGKSERKRSKENVSKVIRNSIHKQSEETLPKEIGYSEHNLNKKYSKSDFEFDKLMFSLYSSIYQQSGVNCAGMFKGDKQALDHGIKIANETAGKMLKSQYFQDLAKNCKTFITTRGYITSVLSKQEEEFPIAFSIVAYKQVEMVERVLRSVYRPQNFYCIHIDRKANDELIQGIKAIVNCFPNVFMASERINVKWATFSVLRAELICMKDLYYRGKWKYFINLTGQEMPLKTNLELVKILTAYQGANDIEATTRRVIWRRFKRKTLGDPPKNMRITKGSVHIVANRHYVDYIINNETAIKLLNYTRKTAVPDETYFSMLNHNPQLGIPGTYKGHPEVTRSNRKPFLTRFKNWRAHIHHYPCAGKRVRRICVLSTGDLPVLEPRMELIANKFYLREDRVAVGCMEERNFNHTRDGFLGLRHFDTSPYEGLDFVINQVGRNTTRKFKEIKRFV